MNTTPTSPPTPLQKLERGATPDHRSLASVMMAINGLGVQHPELPALRQRALALYKDGRDLRGPASVAMVFWAAIRRGATAANLLAAPAADVLRLARLFEQEAYELKRLTAAPIDDKRAARRARRTSTHPPPGPAPPGERGEDRRVKDDPADE